MFSLIELFGYLFQFIVALLIDFFSFELVFD
jgi:hypothetical protein